MKRLSWILFLCAFLVLLVSPVWADDEEDTTVDVSTYTIKAESFDLFKYSTDIANLLSKDTVKVLKFVENTTYYISADFSIDLSTRTKSLDIQGNGAILMGSKDETVGRTIPVILISGDGASGTKVSGLTFQNISMDLTGSKTGGGAIQIVSADDVTIENCSFDKNVINGNKDNKTYIGGAAIFVQDAKGLKITGSYFNENILSFDTGDAGEDNPNTGVNEMGGGAIYVLAGSRDVDVTITGSSFTSNDINPGTKGTTGSGGAIAAVLDKDNNKGESTSLQISLDISKTTFENNNAGRYGGAIAVTTDAPSGAYGSIDVTIKDSTFTGNYINNATVSGTRGGAVMGHAYSGYVHFDIQDSTFTGNYASADKFMSKLALPTGAAGGAVGFESGVDGLISASIKGSLFDGNYANWGGAVATLGASGSVDLEVSNSTFKANSLIKSGDKEVDAAFWTVGSAVATRANSLSKALDSNGDRPGRAFTKIINTTFYSNDALFGGAVANVVSDDGSFVSTDIIHATFVKNVVSGASKDNGADIYTVMTGTKGQTSSDIIVRDSIFYTSKYSIGAQSEDAVFSLDKVAVVENHIVSTDSAVSFDAIAGSSDLFVISADKFTAASEDNSTSVDINGVTHTYFKLTKDADEPALISSGDKVEGVEKDLLSYPYGETPSLGAVQYATFALDGEDTINLGELKAGSNSEDAYQFEINSSDTSFVIASVDWTVKYTSPDEESESFVVSVDTTGKLSVTTTEDVALGEYTFDVTAKGQAGSNYENYSDNKSFTITIIEAAAAELSVSVTTSELTLSTTVGTPKSIDLTTAGVKVGEEDVTEEYTVTWTTEEDLETYGLTLEDGVLSTDATVSVDKTFTFTVTVTKDDATGTAEVTVVVSIDEAGSSAFTLSTDTPEVTVAKGGTVNVTISHDSTVTLSWALSGDSIGLSGAEADDGTYVLSGTVLTDAETGEHVFTITASDDSSNTDSIEITVTVTEAATVLADSYSFTARKGVATEYTVTPTTAGTGVTWTLTGDDLPEWVKISEQSDASATITAKAPTSEKTNSSYTFQVVATNTAGEVTADVTVTVVGGIYGVDSDYTEGTYTFPATRVTGTNAAGQPTATTTSVFRNAANDVMVSVDITITTESTDISCMSGDEISTPVSVDVAIYVADENYTDYASEITVTIPDFLDISGDELTDSGTLENGDKHYDYVLSGTPTASGDYAISIAFDVYASGDIPVLNATDSIDVTLKVGAVAAQEQYTGEGEVTIVGEDGHEYTYTPSTNENGEAVVVITGDGGGNLQEALKGLSPELLATTVVEVGAGVSTLGDLENSAIRSLDLTEASSVTDGTLNLGSNKSIKSITMGSNTSSAITSVNIADSGVEVFTAAGSNIASLTVAGSDAIQTIDVSRTPMGSGASNYTLDVSGCPNLTDLTADNLSSNANVAELIAENCQSLVNVQAKDPVNPRNGIKRASFRGSPNLEHIGLRGNRLLWQYLGALEKLIDADFSGQNEFLEYTMGRMSFGSLFNRTASLASVEDAEEEEDAEDSPNFAKVADISAWDADDNPIEANYDSATGEVVFTQAPAAFSYVYKTDAKVDGGNVEVNVDGNNQVLLGDGPGDASGGCDAGFGGMFAAAVVLAALISKKR